MALAIYGRDCINPWLLSQHFMVVTVVATTNYFILVAVVATTNHFSNHYDSILVVCDAPNPGGPLTTRQLAEDSWMLGNLTPHHLVPFSQDSRFNENRAESPLYGDLHPKYNLCIFMATCPNIIQRPHRVHIRVKMAT